MTMTTILGLFALAAIVVTVDSFHVVAPTRTITAAGVQSSTQLQATVPEFALLFDCDGVILETEELHRIAYNSAFQKFDLKIDGEPVIWSVRTVWFYVSFSLVCR